jgi:hypothetical protein
MLRFNESSILRKVVVMALRIAGPIIGKSESTKTRGLRWTEARRASSTLGNSAFVSSLSWLDRKWMASANT